MKAPPLVSVCMITYAHENFIEQAINGVLMQECDFEIELILSNDRSPDNTDDVIQRIIKEHPRASRIRYLNQEKNLGMGANFLAALAACTGKYIALCDGDDYWTDAHKLQKQVDFLEANPDYVLNFHKVSVLKTDGEIVADFLTDLPVQHETALDIVEKGNYIHTPSVVFRNVVEQYPDEFIKSPIADHFLYILLSKYGKAKYFADDMAVYRYGVGILTSKSNVKMTTDLIRFYSCLLAYLEDQKLKEIIFKKQDLAIDRLIAFTKYQSTRNTFLSKDKSLLDLGKIILKKTFKI